MFKVLAAIVAVQAVITALSLPRFALSAGVYPLVVAALLWAFAELIGVALAIEANTRNAASSVADEAPPRDDS